MATVQTGHSNIGAGGDRGQGNVNQTKVQRSMSASNQKASSIDGNLTI